MGIENREIQNEIPYPEELEISLGVSDVVDELVEKFDAFLQKNNFNLRDELHTLRAIKDFIHLEKDEIQPITRGSALSEQDCLTLSLTTCLLSHRKGYEVKIGMPKKITGHFHSVVVKNNGEMFQVAGRDRNYPVKTLEIPDVVKRVKYIRPIVNTANKLADRYKR